MKFVFWQVFFGPKLQLAHNLDERIVRDFINVLGDDRNDTVKFTASHKLWNRIRFPVGKERMANELATDMFHIKEFLHSPNPFILTVQFFQTSSSGCRRALLPTSLQQLQ